ncbi:hypothetical protein TNCV_2207341 [Trichonephila clavipes]|uniref:Uncharacterized protein n=1 Tax=Trichonephila clavipes TaxID=2585209 RepID=A0A8X6VET8_TRICX|nr:hypothetical protein TNCV_2207341 [Trichonephila clavipes]
MISRSCGSTRRRSMSHSSCHNRFIERRLRQILSLWCETIKRARRGGLSIESVSAPTGLRRRPSHGNSFFTDPSPHYQSFGFNDPMQVAMERATGDISRVGVLLSHSLINENSPGKSVFCDNITFKVLHSSTPTSTFSATIAAYSSRARFLEGYSGNFPFFPEPLQLT